MRRCCVLCVCVFFFRGRYYPDSEQQLAEVAALGVRVETRSVALSEIKAFLGGAAGEAMAERRAVICLLDWAVVLAHYHASAEPRGYSGHYVVLLGFDEDARAVVLEPGLSAALGACAEGPGVGRCVISEAAFNSARLANGTDEVRSLRHAFK